jgi:hypothetical protein
MMMEHGFSDEMAAQEDLKSKQSGQTQESWMARAKAAIAGDEPAEPFQFKPQVCPPLLPSDISPLFD